ncbi:hypothetical protein [Pedobacter gandavensis]|uniref:L,D-transpeptidase n=1 Tax=Pedobacter gandavensis TaxID=2679963 RepID=A0ABR6ESZ4_9SPHI|nr:hypothetical protein [Pedobacter gandavensis]MBB2148395.1 hypothetical protein [Pedobacter gandavensis]
MKNRLDVRFISKALRCLLIALFAFMSYHVLPTRFQKELKSREYLQPITSSIDQSFTHHHKLAPGIHLIRAHTLVYEYANPEVPKRIFKYKLPTQTLKILYKKNRVAILYSKPIYQNRKQVDGESTNKNFEASSGRKIWQLLRQNETYLPPFFCYRMQRGDISFSDDPLPEGVVS